MPRVPQQTAPGISIHAPRAGGDRAAGINTSGTPISIHAPRAGGDPTNQDVADGRCHFNPRPPCGGRRVYLFKGLVVCDFNPRPPCGGRRRAWGIGLIPAHHISIHAPRAGGDLTRILFRAPITDFNPRPPCGGRLNLPAGNYNDKQFQSTPPVRGATSKGAFTHDRPAISIHAPRAGGDKRNIVAG